MWIWQKKARGFSLVEVLAGVLLLAGLISIVVQLSYGNTRRMKKSRQLEKMASLLELKMRELEEEFEGENIANLPDQDKGEFEGEDRYSWSYETQPLALPQPSLLLSLAQLPENELNSQMAQTLIGVAGETVVELELTVHSQTEGGKEMSHSLTAYFINYEDAPDFIFNRLRELLPAGPAL